MGNYTELFIRVEFCEDVPSPVLLELGALMDTEPEGLSGTAELADDAEYDKVTDHELFESPDWPTVLTKGDYVTPTAQRPVQLWIDETDSDQWRLIVHCSAKNYHRSFEKFLDWIMPYVDAEPGEFLGFIRNEDNAGELRLIFYPPAERRYLKIVETSPGRSTAFPQMTARDSGESPD